MELGDQLAYCALLARLPESSTTALADGASTACLVSDCAPYKSCRRGLTETDPAGSSSQDS